MGAMKGLLLMSGGFDSPVAGYMMRRQGFEVVAVHFSLEPLTDDTAEKKSRILAGKIGCSDFIVLPFGFIQAEIAKQCSHRFFYLLTRRMMFRIAEQLAHRIGADFLITGENIGQVASQTLSNLKSTTSAVRIQMVRPVLCFDKNEIISFAKRIGTYDVSKGPEMCSVLGPKHPMTGSRLEDVESEESRLDVDALVAASSANYKND
ncbi:hypothetical protein JW968_04940 [Candidatus Woesearchaeota archaeon]|nr:hypothetical protein [Candidatus Woesearchaeota archaeon]